MSLDLATIGIAMDTSGLEKGTAALKNTEQAANKTADAADKASKSFVGIGTSSDKARSATERMVQGINDQIQKLETQAKTFGMSERQAMSYKLAMDGATNAQIKQADAAMKSVESLKQARELGESIGNAVKVASVALAGFAIAGVYAFEKLIGSVSRYQDLAEQTGGDPAGIASLRTAADVGGVSVDALAMSAVRLEKNLSKVDDESKGAGKALAAIGIELDSFKKLTADEKLREIGRSLNKYADDGSKVALIQDVMGRGSAQYLSALKELGKETEKHNGLTNDQIALADDYKDKQAKVRSEVLQMVEIMAVGALPAVTGLITAFKETIVQIVGVSENASSFDKNKAVETWARGAAEGVAFVGDALLALVRIGNVVSTSLQSVFADLKLVVTVAANTGPMGSKLVFKENRDNIAKALADRNAVVAKSDAALNTLMNSSASIFRDTLKRSYVQQEADRKEAAMRAFRAAEKGYTNDKPSTGYDSVKPTKTGAGKSGNGEQKAQLAYDLDQYRKYSEAIVNTYGNSEKIMEAMRANGLVDEAQYYASKLAFVKINSEQKQTALEQEIARMQQEKFVGKDAATEKLNNDRKVLDSQAKIEKIKEDALATTRVIEIQQTAAINKTAKAYRDAEDAAKSYLDSLQRAQGRELGGMGLGNQERGRLAGRAQIEDKYDQDRRSLEKTKRDAMASDTFGGDAKAKYDNELERINRFKTDALGSYDEYFQSRLEKERNFQTGASEAMNNYLTDVGNVAKQSENLFTKAFKGMEDALVNFAKTGKLDFKSLADSIISDMIRMQIQQSIMKPLSQAMSGGGGFGGLIGGIAGLFGGGGGFSPMGGAGGSMGGGGDFGLGSVNPASGEYFGSLEFDGGGYTGSGSRSGGLDGKGGFMAMMHPQETVIDHSKGQAIPGGQAGTSNTVNVTLSNNITVAGGIGSGEAYAAIQKALAENNRQWTEQLKRQGVLA